MKGLAALATLFCLGLVAAPAPARPTPREAELLRAINRVRVDHGLAPMRVDPVLERAARAQSRRLIQADSFSHGDVRQRLMRFGVRGRAIGENLAWGVGPLAAAPAIVQAWLASPAHRANLLRPGFRRIGVGRAVGTFRGYSNAAVITADFAGR